MSDTFIDVDDFFADDAKGDPELLDLYFQEAVKQFKDTEFGLCQHILHTYIVGSEISADVANFLNMPEAELLKKLKNTEILPKNHLEAIIAFLQLDLLD